MDSTRSDWRLVEAHPDADRTDTEQREEKQIDDQAQRAMATSISETWQANAK
jgi:hypothetical protein